MNLSALLKSLVRNNVVSVSVQPPVARTKPLTWKNPRFADGMDAPVARPKVPGIGTPAPKESNGDYVTRLYRDLLGRAPDAGGYAAHMNGLATGTSRDALKQTFLDSAEYRDLHAAKPTPPPAVVPPEAPVAPIAPAPKLTEEQQFRKLIAADILSSGGRVANATDYAYWLPMLQSPCDSGLVTSGQMTGTEYYHRRILGWQAGGDDVAKFGPYAGGVERGPVPSAIEVMAR